MNRLSFLDFQYKIAKLPLMKPLKRLSIKDRQVSDLQLTFRPNQTEMRLVFDKIDSDKDGKISRKDLKWLLEALGKKNNIDAQLKCIMRAADLDKDGFIDFDEFMEVHKKEIKACDIRRAFWMFDTNGDGRIGAEEVRAMLSKLDETCSLEECERMVRQVDKNGDGLVDMDDFMAMMTRNLELV